MKFKIGDWEKVEDGIWNHIVEIKGITYRNGLRCGFQYIKKVLNLKEVQTLFKLGCPKPIHLNNRKGYIYKEKNKWIYK